MVGKSTTAASKVQRKPSNPKTSEMVLAAVTALNDRKGTSLSAIKKYVSSTYKVDTDRIATFIRRYLRKAVSEGALVQVKGNGASGSFKLPSAEKKKTSSSGSKKRGRPATSDSSKKATPKKSAKKLESKSKPAKKEKKTGATSAKKPKVKSTAAKKKTAAKKATATPKKQQQKKK